MFSDTNVAQSTQGMRQQESPHPPPRATFSALYPVYANLPRVLMLPHSMWFSVWLPVAPFFIQCNVNVCIKQEATDSLWTSPIRHFFDSAFPEDRDHKQLISPESQEEKNGIAPPCVVMRLRLASLAFDVTVTLHRFWLAVALRIHLDGWFETQCILGRVEGSQQAMLIWSLSKGFGLVLKSCVSFIYFFFFSWLMSPGCLTPPSAQSTSFVLCFFIHFFLFFCFYNALQIQKRQHVGIVHDAHTHVLGCMAVPSSFHIYVPPSPPTPSLRLQLQISVKFIIGFDDVLVKPHFNFLTQLSFLLS